MSNQITSKVIGQLTQDAQFSDWWISKEVPVPFFSGKRMTITFIGFEPDVDKSFVSEADEALTNFFALGDLDRENISHHVYKNCIDFLNHIEFDDADQELWDIKDEKEIWKYVEPGEVYVERRPYKDQDMFVHISCECDWEQEHGLQLVFRHGKKLTRVSAQDGHLTEADAFDKPDEEDELLSKF